MFNYRVVKALMILELEINKKYFNISINCSIKNSTKMSIT